MTKADAIKIAKLSGRIAFRGIAITADVGKIGVKVTDSILGSAGKLASDFSGSKSSNIASGMARGAANKGFDLIKRFSLWGEKKLR